MPDKIKQRFIFLLGKTDESFLDGVPKHLDKLITELTDLLSEIDDVELKGEYYVRLSSFHIGKGSYMAASDAANLAIEYLKEMKGSTKESNIYRVYNSLGIIYNHLGSYDLAVENYEAYIDYLKKNKKYDVCCIVLYNLAGTLTTLKQFEKAEKALTEAQLFDEKYNRNKWVVRIAMRQADIMMKVHEYRKAVNVLKSALDKAKRIDAESIDCGVLYNMQGICHLHLADYKKSIYFLHEGLKIFKKKEYKKGEVETFVYLNNNYEAIGDYKSAHFYLKKLNKYRISELEEKLKMKENEIESRLEISHKNLLIENQREIIRIEELAKKKLNAEIERRKESEIRLVKLNEELDRFVATASHDLKEPLGTIQGFSKVLLSRVEDDEMNKEILNHIIESSRRMKQLLLDLLQYSRSNFADITKVDLNINDIVDIVKSNLQEKINESRAIIEMKNDLTVYSNKVILTQIFQNILSNGIKYQPQGQTPKIFIESHQTNKNWFVKITDNGIGIPANKLDDIFQPFVRLYKKEYEGTGVGLATVKKMVERLDGEIYVTSKLEKGTSFLLKFKKKNSQEHSKNL